MTKSMHDEKWVKRWLKRTVSITLGVVVGVLINGGVVFAQDTASLEATVRAQQEQINALIKEVNALKNELSTREQVVPKKVRSVELTPMGVTAPVTGGENTPVALSGVDTITGVGPVTVSTNDRNANIGLADRFNVGDITVDGTNNQILIGQDNICLSTNETKLNGVTIGSTEINTGRKKISGLAAGTNEGDAIVYEQFYGPIRMTIMNESKGESSVKNINIHNSGYNYIFSNGLNGEWCDTHTIKIGLGNKVEIKNDSSKGTGNIILEAVGNNSSIKLQDLKISNTGITVPNNSIVKIGDITIDGHSMNFGTQKLTITPESINVGGGKITNIGAGTVAGDAVNYGQLKGVENKLKKPFILVDSTGKKHELTKETDMKFDNSTPIKLYEENGMYKFDVLGNFEMKNSKGQGVILFEVDGDEPHIVFNNKGSEITPSHIKLGLIDISSDKIVVGPNGIAIDFNSGISLNQKKLTGIPDPENDDDAVNYKTLCESTSTLESRVTAVDTKVDRIKDFNYKTDNNVKMSIDLAKEGSIFGINGDESTIETSSTGKGDVKIGLKDKVVKNNFTLDSTAGTIELKNSSGKTAKLTPISLQFGDVKIENTGINAGNLAIGEVGTGVKPNDAVNKAQLDIVKGIANNAQELANKGWYYKTDSNKSNVQDDDNLIKPGETFNVVGSGAIRTLATKIDDGAEKGKKQLVIEVKDKFKEGKFEIDKENGEIKINPVSLSDKGLIIAHSEGSAYDTVISSKDIKFGGKTVQGVGAGQKDDDAVNVGQLNKQIIRIEQNTTDISNVALSYAGNKSDPASGSQSINLKKDTLTIKGTDSNIVTTAKDKGIIELELNDTVTIGKPDNEVKIDGTTGTVATGTTVIATDKVQVGDVTIKDNRISGLADAINDTDAVNKGQLDAQITELGKKSITIAGNDNKNISKKLGESFAIKGNDESDETKINNDYSTGNIVTYSDGNIFRIAMAKSPKFDSISIENIKMSAVSESGKNAVKFSSDNNPVELRGVAPGTKDDSVITKKQFDEAINKNSAAVEGISLKYAGNTAETGGKSYQMSLKTDTLTIKGNENSKNIVTTTKNKGTIELDLGDTVTIGKPGNEVKIDGTAGTVTTGTTVIAKDKIQVGAVNIAGNKISGLSDGVDDHDAATVGQLNAMKNTVIGDAADAALGKIKVNYEGNSTIKKDVPLTNGEINVVIKGESENRTDGKTNIISTVESNGEIDLDLDKKVVIGEGDNQITINGDDTDPDGNGGTIKVGTTEIKKDGIDVELATGKKVVINNKGINAGQSTITNVADGVNDHDAVNVKQLKELSSMVTSSSTLVKGSGAAIVTPVTEEGHKGYNVHVNKVVQFTDKDGRDVVKVGNNFHIVKDGVVSSTTIAAKDIYTRMVNPDGTTTTPTKLGNVAPGKVAPGSTDAVNGSQLYETQQMIVNNNAFVQQNARQIRELRSDLNNGMAQMAAMSSVEFTGVAPNKVRVAAGLGAYKGARAVAVGVGYSPQEAFLINAKWSTPTNTHRGSAVGIGASYEFNFD